MELHVTLDTADLARLRAQPVVTRCRQGRTRTSREAGTLWDGGAGELRHQGMRLAMVRRGAGATMILRHRDGSETRARLPASAVPAAPAWCGDLVLAPALQYRLTLSVCVLGGENWRAEMRIQKGEACLPGRADRRFCLLSVRLTEGGPQALGEILQALAARVPLVPTLAKEWSDLATLWSESVTPLKSKPPRLPPGVSSGAALRSILATSLEQLVANHECLLQTGDAESVHQMRVALRRLRSAMSLFRALLKDPPSQAVSEELRWMLRMLGAARDQDVLMADIILPLDPLVGSMPGFEELKRQVFVLQSKSRATMKAQLSAPRFVMALLRLACWCSVAGIGQPAGDLPVRAMAQRTLARRYRQVRRGIADIAGLDQEAQHQCRLRVKKLRYAVEFFISLLSARHAQKFIDQLAQLQDRLGALNDIATATKLLQAIALHAEKRPASRSRASATEIALAAGLVIGWHRRRSVALLAQAIAECHPLRKLPPLI